MKKLFRLFIPLVAVTYVVSCSQQTTSEQVVQYEEIQKYLKDRSFEESTKLEGIQKNIEFWKQKLAKDPGSLTYQSKLASAYSRRFRITKDIDDLQRADSLYKKTYEQSAGKNVEIVQSLANLSITKHQFRDAYKYSEAALKIGDEQHTSMLLLFDVMMERGDYQLAKQNLDRLKNSYSFPYLIRLSKFKDYEGQLDSAIQYMEEAKELVEHNTALHAWSKSSLGDMYGHANHVEKSYQAYLDVLQMEDTGGSYLHSLQGIAWIAFAHDENIGLAEQILQFVDDKLQSPDAKRILAEIADFEGDAEKKEKYLRAFVNEAQKPAYFGMYDAYLVDIAASEMDSTEWAMELVENELVDRPTPQMYDLQAWTYLHQDKPEKALEVIGEYVEGQTKEPSSAYHMAEIYKANGLEQKAREYFREVLEAGYEMGPVIKKYAEQEIKR